MVKATLDAKPRPHVCPFSADLEHPETTSLMQTTSVPRRVLGAYVCHLVGSQSLSCYAKGTGRSLQVEGHVFTNVPA